MNDFSDLFFMIAAMGIFGMLTINTARNFQTTSTHTYQTDLEFRAISLAQDEIDAIRWIENEDLLNPNDSDYLYDNDPINKTLIYGDSDQYSETFTINRSSTKIADDAFGNDRYKIEVTVESDAVTPKISGTLEFVKTFELN